MEITNEVKQQTYVLVSIYTKRKFDKIFSNIKKEKLLLFYFLSSPINNGTGSDLN